MNKEEIRQNYLQKRLKYKQSELEEFSEKIIQKLRKSAHYQNAKNVLFYLPIRNEVNIKPLFDEALEDPEKIVLLTRTKEYELSIHKITSKEELETSALGIPEPKADSETFPLDKIDLILVPGIAFAKDGYRIGFGKGYYDGLLSKTNAKTIGLAYDFQILNNVPVDSWDQKVDFLIHN